MHAFDYETQQWISGPAAEKLHKSQMTEELALIESPRGQDYLDSMRRRGEPRRIAAHVAAAIRKELAS